MESYNLSCSHRIYVLTVHQANFQIVKGKFLAQTEADTSQREKRQQLVFVSSAQPGVSLPLGFAPGSSSVFAAVVPCSAATPVCDCGAL